MNAAVIATAIIMSFFMMIQSAVSNNNSSPLHMDVEWILQGKTFGFSGFFVEILGISRAIRAHLPHLRLAQSFLYESFNESPLPPSTTVCANSGDSTIGLNGEG